MFGRGGANVNRRSDRRASLFSEAASPNTWKKNETFYTVSSEQPPMGSITQAGPPPPPPPIKKNDMLAQSAVLGFHVAEFHSYNPVHNDTFMRRHVFIYEDNSRSVVLFFLREKK